MGFLILYVFYAENRRVGKSGMPLSENLFRLESSLNPNASEASNKPKQRSYRKTNLKKKFWHPIVPAPKCPTPKCPAPKRQRRVGGTETYPTPC